MKRLWIAMALVIGLSGMAEALESVTAKELAGWCSTKDNTHIALCSGYFMGYLEYNSMVQFGKPWKERPWDKVIQKNCISRSAHNWDVVEAFLSYLKDRPEEINYWAFYVIKKSIETKWPCNKSDTRE